MIPPAINSNRNDVENAFIQSEFFIVPVDVVPEKFN